MVSSSDTAIAAGLKANRGTKSHWNAGQLCRAVLIRLSHLTWGEEGMRFKSADCFRVK